MINYQNYFVSIDPTLQIIDPSYCDCPMSMIQWGVATHHCTVLYCPPLQVSVEELKTLLTRYADTDKLAMNGVTVGGTKYMFLSATDRVVRGKKGTSGVHCIKTVQGESGVRPALSHHRAGDLEQSQPAIMIGSHTCIVTSNASQQ